MKFLQTLTPVLTAGLALVQAVAIPETHVLHEKRSLEAGKRIVKRTRVESAIRLPVRIGLTQNREALEKAEGWLMDVAGHGSDKYAQHWTQEEVIEAFRPSDDSVDAVKNWVTKTLGIADHEVTHSDNKLWLAFEASMGQLEGLLHTSYFAQEDGRGRSTIACDEYHLPKEIQQHVDYITPGVKAVEVENTELRKRTEALEKRGRRTRGSIGFKPPMIRPFLDFIPPRDDVSRCDVAITPACLRALYDFTAPSTFIPVSPENRLGIFEEGDYYAQQDLNLFYANFTPYIPQGYGPKVDGIDGGQAPTTVLQDAGGESDLDLELAIPIIYPQGVTVYQTDDLYYATESSEPGIFNTFLDAIDGSYCTYCAYGECGNSNLDPTYPDPRAGGYKGKLQCGVYKPTKVISISYGEQENDLPASYQERQCNEFLKLGLQGISIFVASGDSGVAGPPGDPTADGCLKDGTVFSPTQPNSCPWLTNVGATKVLPGRTVHEPESAPDDPAGHPYSSAFYSGGGFSNIFTTPDYQAKAVSTFFRDHNPPYKYYTNGNYQNSTGRYNRNGRGIPDVAANGDNIATYVGGKATLEGGTSASSPIFASLVNRINEERLRIGKKSVGFVNPVLYSNPWVLNDIVNGTNPGCGTQGFSCAPGWDPVTGLGTPNYPKMLALFLALP